MTNDLIFSLTPIFYEFSCLGSQSFKKVASFCGSLLRGKKKINKGLTTDIGFFHLIAQESAT